MATTFASATRGATWSTGQSVSGSSRGSGSSIGGGSSSGGGSSRGGGGGGGRSTPAPETSVSIKGNEVIIDGLGYSVVPGKVESFLASKGLSGGSYQSALQTAKAQDAEYSRAQQQIAEQKAAQEKRVQQQKAMELLKQQSVKENAVDMFERIAQQQVEAIAREEEKKIKEITDRKGNVVGFEYNNMSIASNEGLQKVFQNRVGERFNENFQKQKAASDPANAAVLEKLERKGTISERINYFTKKAMKAQDDIETEFKQRQAKKISEAIKDKNYLQLAKEIPATTLKGLGVVASGALLEASVGTINDISQLTMGGAGAALIAGIKSGDIKLGESVVNSLSALKGYYNQNPLSAFGRTVGAVFDAGEIASLAGKSGKIGQLAKLNLAEKALKKAGKQVDNIVAGNLANLNKIGNIQTIRKVLTDSEISKYISGTLKKSELEDITRKVATIKKVDLPAPKVIPKETIKKLNDYKKALQEAQRQINKPDYAKMRKVSKKLETPDGFELRGKAQFSKQKILDQKSREVITEEFGKASVRKLPKGDLTIKELKKFEGAVFEGKKGKYSEAITIDKNGWTKGVKNFKDKYKIEYIVQPNGKATFKYYYKNKLVGTVNDFVNPKGLKVSSIRDKLFMPKTGLGRTAFGTLNYSASAGGWRKLYGKVGDYRLTLKQVEKRTVRQLVTPLEMRTTSRFRGYTKAGKKVRRTEFEIQYLNAMISKNGMTNGQLADIVKKEVRSFVDQNSSGIVKVKREVYTPVVANLQKNIIEIRYKLRAMNGKKSLADKFRELNQRLSDSQYAAARFKAGMNKRGSASLMNLNMGVNSFDPLGALELKKLLNRKLDLKNPKFEFSDPMLNSLKGLDIQLPALKLTGVGKEYLEFLARRTLLLRRSMVILQRRGINVNKLLPRVRQLNRQVQRQRSVQRQRQRQVQKPIQITVNRAVSTQTTRTPRIKIPQIKIKDIDLPKFRMGVGKAKVTSGARVNNAFKVEILRGKKYVRINNKLYTEKDAKNKLAYVLDRDKSRTARVVNVGKGSISKITPAERNYLGRKGNKFRSYRILNKKKTRVSQVRLIEKRRYFNDLERLGKKRRR